MSKTNTEALKYNVTTLRAAGLEAKWSKSAVGAPRLLARDPHAPLEHARSTWWAVDRGMWAAMQKQGVREGFRSYTLLGDIFSVRA